MGKIVVVEKQVFSLATSDHGSFRSLEGLLANTLHKPSDLIIPFLCL